MYKVFHNSQASVGNPNTLVKWLDDLHQDGLVLVAATGTLFIFRKVHPVADTIFYIEYVNSQHIRLIPAPNWE